MDASFFGPGFWMLVFSIPVIVSAVFGYFLLTLPMRRAERARLFLDLVEQGLRDGRSPEQTIVGISESRDRSVGVRFHLLAAHIECGRRLGEALERVPRFLPPQVV